MAKANPSTVILKGDLVRKEANDAAGGIVPGDLVALDANGDLVVHALATQECSNYAIENSILGKGIDDAYGIGDRVLYGSFQKGAEVYARVAASAPAISKGDYLESAGDGTVRAATTNRAIAIALEDVDNSGGTEKVRIKLEVI